jgi:hypothetical protein
MILFYSKNTIFLDDGKSARPCERERNFPSFFLQIKSRRNFYCSTEEGMLRKRFNGTFFAVKAIGAHT